MNLIKTIGLSLILAGGSFFSPDAMARNTRALDYLNSEFARYSRLQEFRADPSVLSRYTTEQRNQVLEDFASRRSWPRFEIGIGDWQRPDDPETFHLLRGSDPTVYLDYLEFGILPTGFASPRKLIPNKISPWPFAPNRLQPVCAPGSVWDCDDYAFAWCKSAIDPASCRTISMNAYTYHHAIVIERTRNADGTYRFCYIEPANGETVVCYNAVSPDEWMPYFCHPATNDPCECLSEVQKALQKHFLVEGEMNEILFRLTVYDPNELWGNWEYWWEFGEDPWFESADERTRELICRSLRDSHLDECAISGGRCNGCPKVESEED